jgi:DNA-binding MarR family transcriptional regulator
MPSEIRSVAEEIAQDRPFPSPVQEALVTLLRTTDEVRRLLSSFVEPQGVTLQQYNVLRILRGAGSGGLPTLEIGRRMLERQPGVTRLVDRLVAKELVRRARDSEDRRQVMCSIRPEGLTLLSSLDEELEGVGHILSGGLGESEIRGLTDLLNRLRASIPQR